MSYESNVPTKVKCLYCRKSIRRETYAGNETGVWHKQCKLTAHNSEEDKG